MTHCVGAGHCVDPAPFSVQSSGGDLRRLGGVGFVTGAGSLHVGCSGSGERRRAGVPGGGRAAVTHSAVELDHGGL